MKTLAIYPGTFDPLTLGHVDLVRRAARMFGRLILAISDGTGRKQPLFTLEERRVMAGRLARDFENVEVDTFDGLLVDYARRRNCRILVRGIRAFSDFEFEFQMALTNRKMEPDLETIFLMPQERFSTLSSGMVREIARFGGDLRPFVPGFVRHALERKRSAPGGCSASAGKKGKS
ncbi:MAG: pantetheine-phosphate adenylyltransferase [Lentisphaerae bacterium]|nr:pantetheine-phosphate adenylyltransferase [Lentisphaerota bacterium]